MGFDAANAVPALDWDFTRYKGGKGTSPEPSNEALYEFNVRFRNLIEATVRTKKALAIKEAERLNERSTEEKAAEVERWAAMTTQEAAEALFAELSSLAPAEEILQLSDDQAKLVAEVLQDCPSVEQIYTLPGRVRAAYFGWVVGQLTNPEFGAADTI